MAHAIIFTDRAPQTYAFDKVNFLSKFYTYSAGAYKIASELRKLGLKVIVIPNCLSLSLNAVKRLIDQNSKDLLWVGISTTFLSMRTNNVASYREIWHTSTQDIIPTDPLYHLIQTFDSSYLIPWDSKELNAIADYAWSKYCAETLIGGSWVTNMRNGNLTGLNDHVHIIEGYAEKYVEEFSIAKLQNKKTQPPYIVNNSNYNDLDFKHSIIQWESEDLVTPDMWLPLEISRGCAFNCAYCNYDRKSNTDSFKDPDTLYNELIRNYELWGTTKYVLLDDLYNDSKDKVRILHDRVWSRLPFKPQWVSYMRLDMIWADRESAEIILASGAKGGSFGIETLNEKAGKKVGKGLGPTRIIETLEFLKDTWKDQVMVEGLFISGLPYEPADSIENTVNWAINTDLLHSYAFTPMWITPPLHKDLVLKTSSLSDHYEKYGIQWISDNNWINTEGVTFDLANQLAAKANQELPSGIVASVLRYPDIEAAGFSHSEIVNFKKIQNVDDRMKQGLDKISNLINQRLNKVLTISDHY